MKPRQKHFGPCPLCGQHIQLTRFGQPFHQHKRGARHQAARKSLQEQPEKE